MNIKKVEYAYSLLSINPITIDKKISYKVTTQKDEILFVPFDESNTDNKIILQWVADGNTIQEAD